MKTQDNKCPGERTDSAYFTQRIVRLETENTKLQNKLKQLHEAYAVDMSKTNDVIDKLRAELATVMNWNSAEEDVYKQTRDEVFELRAELAAIKPSWADAPQWATHRKIMLEWARPDYTFEDCRFEDERPVEET